jgi:hypothetical protein
MNVCQPMEAARHSIRLAYLPNSPGVNDGRDRLIGLVAGRQG